jgi:hypothetical protein
MIQTSSRGRLTERPPSPLNIPTTGPRPPVVKNLVPRKRCPATENDNKAYNLSFVEIGDEAVMLPSGKCASKSNLLQLHRYAPRSRLNNPTKTAPPPLNTSFSFSDPYSRNRFTLSQELIEWLKS